MTILLYDLVGADAARPFSPHCWKVAMALAHKGLEFKSVPTRFLEVAGVEGRMSKTIPVIRDGDRLVADSFAIDFNLIVIDQFDREQCRIGTKLFHQHRSAPVDKPFGQPRMERIGKTGFDRAGAGRHLFFRKHPVGTLGNVGPTADRGDSHLQGVDIARWIVELGNGPRDEITAELAFAQILPQPRDKPRMSLGPLVAEIG